MTRFLTNFAYQVVLPLIVTSVAVRFILGVDDTLPYLIGAAIALATRTQLD